MAKCTCRAWSGMGRILLLAALVFGLCRLAIGQETRLAATKPTTSTAGFKPEELEQIVAPIALYPDSLLAQIFMAATYPLEIVQADRWAKQNPKLIESPDALNKLTWDPSVKSLLAVPQVLTMMSEKLDWTVKLGDAFIADQKAVMDAVQRLRGKAYSNGNLKTTDQQKVSVQPTTQPSASSSQVIVVESSQPSVVYVPTYNPTVVYGGWAYPSYPPYYYYPPGYVAGAAAISFGVGVAVGAAWGHAWGGCNWHGGDVDIDVDRNVNINNNIDRDKYKTEINNRAQDRGRDNPGGRQKFQHDASHRQGVAYRDAGTTERFRGSGSSQATAQARDSYRGRTSAGQSDLSRGGSNRVGGGSTPGGGTNYRPGSSTPKIGGGPAQTPSGGNFGGSGQGSRSSSFGGVDSGGANTRAASNRGNSSRSSSSYSGSRGGGYSGSSVRSSGGASRSGGGAARSGGGGGRGGGRR